MKNDFIFVVAEVYVIKYDVTEQLLIIDAAVCLMGVFPCPHAGAFFGFREIAVFIAFGIDKGDITFVVLRLFVEQLKDTLGTGECHDDAVHLHTHLVDWLAEVLI